MSDREALAAGLTAVVPLRDGVSGKSRLASVLSGADRRALVTVLARHVVGVLLGSPGVGRVAVVTADVPFTREVLDGVDGAGGIEILAQPPDRPGLNPALEFAREHLGAGAPASGLLIVHADLPALTPADIVALADTPSDVVIATDRAATGTNLLLLRPTAPTPAASAPAPASGPPAGFRFRFGVGSRRAHEAEAGRVGAGSVVVERDGTAVDLDTMDDWAELPARVRHAVGRGVTAQADGDGVLGSPVT